MVMEVWPDGEKHFRYCTKICILEYHIHNTDYVGVESIIISPSLRGKGLATRIINGLKRRYKMDMGLECHENLIPFYEKLGFTVDSQLPDSMFYMWYHHRG